jgi:hypothetical protein
MLYVKIVYLDEFNKIGIQKFFIWGHLDSRLTKFDQVKVWILKKMTLPIKYLKPEMVWSWIVMKTKFANLIKIYISCFGQLFIWQSLDSSNFEFWNFYTSTQVSKP